MTAGKEGLHEPKKKTTSNRLHKKSRTTCNLLCSSIKAQVRVLFTARFFQSVFDLKVERLEAFEVDSDVARVQGIFFFLYHLQAFAFLLRLSFGSSRLNVGVMYPLTTTDECSLLE
jgi:hypothetical protein